MMGWSRRVSRLCCAALFLALLILPGACQLTRSASLPSAPPPSMKGFELYSWEMDGTWYFALLFGTNRLKTWDEISSPAVRIKGIEALKAQLAVLPSGECVFWTASRVSKTMLPADDTIAQIRAYCEQFGLQLEVLP